MNLFALDWIISANLIYWVLVQSIWCRTLSAEQEIEFTSKINKSENNNTLFLDLKVVEIYWYTKYTGMFAKQVYNAPSKGVSWRRFLNIFEIVYTKIVNFGMSHKLTTLNHGLCLEFLFFKQRHTVLEILGINPIF